MTMTPAEGSTKVRLNLIVGERRLPVAQIGPSSCILREPTNLPPARAELVMTIDDESRSWPVFLLNGADEASPLVQYIDEAP